MAILTKFLKLLKPEKNDYVDVEKHLSENYDKIDTKMEELSNSNDEKLNKGAVSSDYDTAKKIEDKIKGINEKFKNFCPYAVGDIYITTNSSNPSTKFLGTTWSKIEGRFLLGTSSSQASKLTGGSMNKNISQVNLPNVKLTVDSFSLSTTSHYHLIAYNQNNYGALTANNYISNAAHIGDHQSYEFKGSINIPNVGKTKDAGGGNTSTASPQTSALGSGQALDITPSYYTAHMWLRTS